MLLALQAVSSIQLPCVILCSVLAPLVCYYVDCLVIQQIWDFGSGKLLRQLHPSSLGSKVKPIWELATQWLHVHLQGLLSSLLRCMDAAGCLPTLCWWGEVMGTQPSPLTQSMTM